MSKAETASLKHGWRRVRLGDVVENVNDFFVDRSGEAIRYIAGEHIDEGDLRVRRSGLTSDELVPPTFKRLFKAGDVLFHSRNIRKLAQPDFDGLTGEKIFILRSRDQRKLPQALLPFLLQTKHFRNYVEERWAGSTNKFLNKTPLMAYEFALPPAHEQERLVNVLQGIERTIEAHREVAASSVQLVRSLLADVLSREWQVVELGSVVRETQYGLSLNAGSEGQYPMLRMMNLEDGLCVENDIKYVDLNDTEFESYRLVHGDVLFNRTNSYELVGRTGVYELEGDHVFASYLVRIETDPERLAPKFLTLYLNSDLGRRQVLAYATKAVSQANVNASNLLRVRLPLPPLDVQKRVLEEIAGAKVAEKAAASRRSSAEEMKTQLLAEIARIAE